MSLSQDAYSRIDTVRDLLREVAQAAKSGEKEQTDPFDEPLAHLSALQKNRLLPLGPIMRFLADGYYYLNRLLMKTIFSLKVEGKEHLPKEGPFILCPNHVSHIDPLTIAASVDLPDCRKLRWAGWTGAILHNPLSRFISYLGRTVPIDPQKATMSSLAVGAAVLEQKAILGWFPEGSRSPEGKLQSFKTGIGRLLEHFDVPIVPVYIEGTFEALPTSRSWPQAHPVTVRFGKPVSRDELAEKGIGDTQIEKITSGLRKEVRLLGGAREK